MEIKKLNCVFLCCLPIYILLKHVVPTPFGQKMFSISNSYW